ncbi:MAG: deoxyribonuclease IV [Candidatus Omnitrophica bacterium]|nr:deoxyribonuclease IV [Candidatus Omnitrophota bacterium]MBD3269114.1 deoxyribonuclease IV [Candidatus Omnitrophota bacterium]
MINLGVHVSIAGSIHKSVGRAAGLGCTTMQIFLRNPRQWRKRKLNGEEIEIFRESMDREKIKPLVVHIPYISNLASNKRRFYKITIREFITDLKEADKLGAHFFVAHMGSFRGGTEILGLLRVANALNRILESTEKVKTSILIENTSGSGKWLGYNFSHFRFVLERLKQADRIGICLDTAHAWAAGYKIDTKSGVDNLLSDIDKKVGIKKLKIIHLNDTLIGLGKKVDRHADIGKGSIGKKGLGAIVNHPVLRNLPFILETPKTNEEDDIRNLNMVRSLVK